MHKVAPSGTFHFISKLDRLCDIVFCPGQGLVVDEACFGLKDADGLKGLLYPKNGADVACRNKDSFIPVGVPRVFQQSGRGTNSGLRQRRKEFTQAQLVAALSGSISHATSGALIAHLLFRALITCKAGCVYIAMK